MGMNEKHWEEMGRNGKHYQRETGSIQERLSLNETSQYEGMENTSTVPGTIYTRTSKHQEEIGCTRNTALGQNEKSDDKSTANLRPITHRLELL